MMKQFDVVIIGGGPGGYVAAIRASQLGKNVALVEGSHLGGICLNWGCIPTKALLRSAEMYRFANHMSEFGIEVSGVKFDIKKIVDRSRSVSAKLSSGIESLMKKHKVTVFRGRGMIGHNKIVTIDLDGTKEEIKARNIIIATGARARVLDGYQPDGRLVLTYKEAMVPESIPQSLIIVGSGAIGIEFASFYSAFGTNVTVVEARDRILSVEDKEISELAKKSFEKQGISFVTSATIGSLKKHKDSVELAVSASGKDSIIKADKIIMAVGISANIENIGLENTKVKIDKGHIVTKDNMQTDDEGIYAIGDVAGGPWLAHKASHEGIIAAESIAGLKAHPVNKHNIPGCTYSMPQIASVGLTEEGAKAAGFDIKIGRFPFLGNGKAIAMGEEFGLVKTIFDNKTGELLGAHMIGSEVTELISGYVIGKNLEATELDFIQTIFAHPTISEAMHESVLNAYSRAIHI